VPLVSWLRQEGFCVNEVLNRALLFYLDTERALYVDCRFPVVTVGNGSNSTFFFGIYKD